MPTSNIRDKFGATSLHYGAAGGTIEIVQMLVTAGADTAKVDCNGMTAMEVATGRHYHETAAAIFQAQQEQATACGPSTIETDNKCAKLQHYPADNVFNVYIHELSLSTDPFDLRPHRKRTYWKKCPTISKETLKSTFVA